MSLLIVILGLALFGLIGGFVYQKATHIPPKWHEGEAWETFLNVYDKFAAEQYSDCDSPVVSSRFGTTQVHVCGNPSNPPIVLFHGIASSSLIYGDWLIPSLLRNGYYTVAVDTLCDIGRSKPTDGDIANCPSDKLDIAEWYTSILTELKLLNKSPSLIGYSYGSFLAAQIAMVVPHQVNKLVLIAPAATFTEIQPTFLTNVVLYGLAFMASPTQAWKDYFTEWFFSYLMADGQAAVEAMKQTKYWELRTASDGAGPPKDLGQPIAFDAQKDLKRMNERNPTMLIIGKEEVITNATLALEAANIAGIETKAYENAGHVLIAEWPREPVVEVVVEFLNRGRSTKAAVDDDDDDDDDETTTTKNTDDTNAKEADYYEPIVNEADDDDDDEPTIAVKEEEAFNDDPPPILIEDNQPQADEEEQSSQQYIIDTDTSTTETTTTSEEL